MSPMCDACSVVYRGLKTELSIQIVQPTGCVSISSIEVCGTEYINAHILTPTERNDYFNFL